MPIEPTESTQVVSLHGSSDEDAKSFAPLGRVTTSGTQNEYIHLGDQKYLRSELEYAFGGAFRTGVNVRPHLKLGNATPAALLAYSVTTLILSLINAGARSVHNYSVMAGSALFYGGAIQVIAGFWELVIENTFGGTVFASYGGFWMSMSVFSMGGFNVESSYESQREFNNAVGLFFLVWGIVSFAFTLCTIRGTVPLFCLLFFTGLTMTLTAASKFALAAGAAGAGAHCGTASGVTGCLSGFIALYNAMAGLLNRENSYLVIRPWYMPGAIRPDTKGTEA